MCGRVGIDNQRGLSVVCVRCDFRSNHTLQGWRLGSAPAKSYPEAIVHESTPGRRDTRVLAIQALNVKAFSFEQHTSCTHVDVALTSVKNALITTNKGNVNQIYTVSMMSMCPYHVSAVMSINVAHSLILGPPSPPPTIGLGIFCRGVPARIFWASA